MSNPIRYTKAPVSEVIIGQTLEGASIPISELMALSRELREDYPVIEVLGPIVDEVIQEGILTSILDVNQSGRNLFRMWTVDRQWLVQFQGNKILVNWMRQDKEHVERPYPGFTHLLGRFGTALKKMEGVLGRTLHAVREYELTYHDRVPYGDLIADLTKLGELAHISPMPINGGGAIYGLEYKQIHAEPRLGGYASAIINTAKRTDSPDIRLLQFQFTLRGRLAEHDMEGWMKKAHQLQLDQFEAVFTKDTLNRWI